MSDFVPPSGPPPSQAPQVPAGWKAQYDSNYKEWFFVNTFTKSSQWEKPTAPAEDPTKVHGGAPSGPPPSYSAGQDSPAISDLKSTKGPGNQHQETDAELAARLQAEENARSAQGSSATQSNQSYLKNSPGHDQSYQYGQPQSQQHGQGQVSPQGPGQDEHGSRGLIGKLLGKKSHSNQNSPGYPPQGYGQQGYPQGGGYGGGYGAPPHMGGGYPPQQGYYGGGGYGPPQQGYYGGGGGGYGPQYQQQQRPGGGGMGMMGGAALGLGGGLLGGALIGNAISDHDQDEYRDGYQDGQNQDQGQGGDYGGGGGDGGDFGGGGGDF